MAASDSVDGEELRERGGARSEEQRRPSTVDEENRATTSKAPSEQTLGTHPLPDCLAHVYLTQLAVRFDPSKGPTVLYDDGNHLILVVSE
eukprot:7129106-Pyramimonas_sp.AAC.1